MSSPTYAASLTAAPTEASGYRFCGHHEIGDSWTYDISRVRGAAVVNVRAKKVWCAKARYVADHYTSWNSWYSPASRRVEFWRGPWTCYSRSTGIESHRTVCKASHGRRVRFAGGS